MRSLASRPPSNTLRMFRKRIHQGADLFESAGYLFGRELFVRKRKLAHLCGVKDGVFQGWYDSDAWKSRPGLPSLDGSADGEFSHLLLRPDAAVHIRGYQRWDCTNCCAKKCSNFWGY